MVCKDGVRVPHANDPDRAHPRPSSRPQGPICPVIRPTHDHLHTPGLLGDLFSLDPANLTWTRLCDSASGGGGGRLPAARKGHGLAAIGERLYVFGGWARGGMHILSAIDLECAP